MSSGLKGSTPKSKFHSALVGILLSFSHDRSFFSETPTIAATSACERSGYIAFENQIISDCFWRGGEGLSGTEPNFHDGGLQNKRKVIFRADLPSGIPKVFGFSTSS
jgi:hypothetical protein